MSENGRTPDLDAVARSDRFLDALAGAEPVSCRDPNDEALAALLGDWRDGLRWPPEPELVSADEAAAALRKATPPRRRRTHRALTLIGSVAATVLALGGVGALVGGAHPGGPLYGLRTMLLGEPPSVHDDRIALTAKTEFEHVQQMIAQGQWDQAQERLTALGDTVQAVNDTQRKQDLIDQWNRLNVQVQNRDPSAVPSASSAPTTELPAVSTPPTSLMLSVPSSETPGATDPDTATASSSETSATPEPWSSAPASAEPSGSAPAQQPSAPTGTSVLPPSAAQSETVPSTTTGPAP
ncbi:anti-sigma-D factor RsdA [Mycobacterium sp. pUA109]|uniref:anti-sigma-D factor RsdA n=1 Tax=Mycobacterium sp. pUA109 TaxID=3238982 RepID=UPI00351B5EC8